MKNHIIISLLFLLIGCSTELDTLQKRGDTYYEINSEEPFSGTIIKKYESGQEQTEGYLKNGREDGVWTYWYENGQKSLEGTFKDWKPDGLSTLWYENGQKKQEGTENEWTYWNEDGSVKE